MQCNHARHFERIKPLLVEDTPVKELAASTGIQVKVLTAWRKKLKDLPTWSPKVMPDLTGQKFSELVVIEKVRKVARYGQRWLCRCTCGNLREVPTAWLTRGSVVSCGCTRARYRQAHHNWTGFGDIDGKHWSNIKTNAKKRGVKVTISLEDVWKLFLEQDGCCALTGVKIAFGKETTASLDRKDPSIGYHAGNVQWVHKTVNRIKQNLQEEDLFAWILKIVNHKNLCTSTN